MVYGVDKQKKEEAADRWFSFALYVFCLFVCTPWSGTEKSSKHIKHIYMPAGLHTHLQRDLVCTRAGGPFCFLLLFVLLSVVVVLRVISRKTPRTEKKKEPNRFKLQNSRHRHGLWRGVVKAKWRKKKGQLKARYSGIDTSILSHSQVPAPH